MDKYTRKYFYKEIKKILDKNDVEEIRPLFIYGAFEKAMILHWSGNKIAAVDPGVGEMVETIIWEPKENVSRAD